MLSLFASLLGLAAIDSLNVLNVGIVSATVYGARLNRISPLPAGLGFISGLFVATTAIGLATVLGLHFATDFFDVDITPRLRYWGELGIGVLLLGVACIPLGNQLPVIPPWVVTALREKPWLFWVLGVVIGSGQAPTSIPYIAGLALIAAIDPRPPLWPLIVVGYTALTLLPTLAVLLLGNRSTPRAQRVQRNLIRGINRYGPMTVRVVFVVIGVALVVDAAVHYRLL
ncbi:GAP family protein [Mycolicibacterium grossiae]|uniref:GAP family protein n=1 Tax=Mycolicibacterium grossiae TaxID=1552759 RepID=A0A1E8Q407_9MYCO|nr:GAP family protein [Mycolicibacterium grossiae]OFJ53127.1 hypothetical protein BEL07_13920 [Mycolicibacterium grossiae]QEM44765.1 hypothetical protein FZ046_08190 [Mycolicibacterium grossiae]